MGILTTVGAWAGRAAGAFLVVTTLLPFVVTGWWIVRVCDFPRVQLGVLALLGSVLAGGLAIAGRGGAESIIWCVVLLAIAVWQASQALPYTSLWPTTLASAEPADGTERGDRFRLRLLTSNVDVRNERVEEVGAAIRSARPDAVLLIETDERWARGLAELREEFAYRVEEVREGGLGIALWSHVPIEEPQVRFTVSEDRPSIRAWLVPEAGPAVRFVGIHPTPPGLERQRGEGRHDSRIRDAELLLVAGEVAGVPDRPWIVAGDFNDVAWSRTTRLFARRSGLRDPRIGRGLFDTYHARHPFWRYPIDHVFLSEGFRIVELRRVRIPGSDHFGILSDLVLDRPAGADPTENRETKERARTRIRGGLDNAREIDDA